MTFKIRFRKFKRNNSNSLLSKLSLLKPQESSSFGNLNKSSTSSCAKIPGDRRQLLFRVIKYFQICFNFGVKRGKIKTQCL